MPFDECPHDHGGGGGGDDHDHEKMIKISTEAMTYIMTKAGKENLCTPCCLTMMMGRTVAFMVWKYTKDTKETTGIDVQYEDMITEILQSIVEVAVDHRKKAKD